MNKFKYTYQVRFRGKGRISGNIEHTVEITTPYDWSKAEEWNYLYVLIREELLRYFDDFTLVSIDKLD